MTTDPELTKSIRKNALSAGLLLGGVSFVLGILSFYYMTTMATSFWGMILGPILIGLVASIVVAVFIILDLRKKIGGFWTFRQATTGIFIMFFVSYVLSSVLTNFGFAKFIEPQMNEKVQAVVMENTEAFMIKSGVPQEKIDAQMEERKKEFEAQNNATFTKKAISVGGSLVLIFVFSLIFAAIFKKEKPLFDAPVDTQE